MKDELYAYCQRPRRTALEVLADFRSIRIPLDYLFDVFGVIRPRKFSIASHLGTHPGKIQLCVAIVQYKSLVLRAPRVGMCSNWLLNLPLGVPNFTCSKMRHSVAVVSRGRFRPANWDRERSPWFPLGRDVHCG